MRRVLAIAAMMAMVLATGVPAVAQTLQVQPKVQIVPKIQPRIQSPPNRPPNLPLIKPSQAARIAQRVFPNSTALRVKLLPGGNYVVTLKSNNELHRVFVDGDTGAHR